MIFVVGLEGIPFKFVNKFAIKGLKVYSVDNDPKKLLNLMNNAKIYGVNSKINIIYSDVLEVEEGRFDWVYCSPPWGGLNYHLQTSGVAIKD